MKRSVGLGLTLTVLIGVVALTGVIILLYLFFHLADLTWGTTNAIGTDSTFVRGEEQFRMRKAPVSEGRSRKDRKERRSGGSAAAAGVAAGDEALFQAYLARIRTPPKIVPYDAAAFTTVTLLPGPLAV